MTPSPEMRAILDVDRWSGHGEGGTLYGVAITGRVVEDIYNSTERDKEQARMDVAWVNKAIEFYRQHVGKTSEHGK